MLFFLGTAFFAFAKVGAAPTKYDQRQDGDFNLQAKLENILFVAVLPASGNHQLSEMALQALEQMVSRSKGQEPIKSDELAHQEEPYSVEIIQINENHPDKESSVRKAVGEDVGTSSVSDQQPAPDGEQTEKAERIARDMKNFDFPKSREVPTIPGYFVNVKKTSGHKRRDGSRAQSVVENVWNSDDESGRPGPSLKKQLPQKGEEDVAQPSPNADKNDVPSFAEEKQQELTLLGDGIENCGPGRHRDATSHICESDGSADSL